MPSTFGRNLHLCFTKIKCTEDPTRPSPNSTSAASILVHNFTSLYNHTFDSTSHYSNSISSSSESSDLSSSESDSKATTPDFATVFASQRFFFSSPGRSNSIIESSSSSPSERKQPESDTVVDGGNAIPVPTFSPDPYKDFRRSMQEMVEARNLSDVRTNWDSLHELLLCYLALNPKSTHRFIVGAFADLIVSLMTFQAQGGDRETDFSVGVRNGSTA